MRASVSLLLSLSLACLSSHSRAQTYTWAGGSSGGAWSGSANWTPPGYPDGENVFANVTRSSWGNPAYITNDTSITLGSLTVAKTGSGSWQKVYIDPAGDKTITLNDASGTFVLTFGQNLNYGGRIGTVLTGANNLRIALQASNTDYAFLRLSGANTYSGDTYVGASAGGSLTFGVSSQVDENGDILSGPLGTGTVWLENNSRIGAAGASRTLHNPIKASGVNNFRPDSNCSLTLMGPIVLVDHAELIMIYGSYWYLYIYGDITEDVPQRNLVLQGNRSEHNAYLYDLRVYGRLKHTGSTTIKLNFVSLHGDNQAATGEFIVKPGARAYLQHTSAISSAAVVSLEYDGAKYGRLSMNQSVTVAGLKLNGVSQPDGEYNYLTHPEYFGGTGPSEVKVGTGTLTVRKPAGAGTLICIQ